MEEKYPDSDSQNKSENDSKYYDSIFSICINNSKHENEENIVNLFSSSQKMEQNEEKDDIINNNILFDKEEYEENIHDNEDIKVKFKRLDEIRKERRRILKGNIFKENKKIPLLSNNKIVQNSEI